MRRQKGFTMIELLVVATIIAVLSMIGMTSYHVANRKARNGRRAADMEQVRAALELYRVSYSRRIYPDVGSWDGLMSYLVSGGNLNSAVQDPKVDAGHANYEYRPSVDYRSYDICYYEEPSNAEICISNP